MMQLQSLSNTPIEALYQAYHQPLVRYLTRIVHNHQTAEDLAHEAFIKAMRFWDNLENASSASGWLFRIAANTAYDYLRRQRRIVPSSDTIDLWASMTTSEASWEDAEPVRTALEHMPSQYRIPLLLQIYGGFAIKEIAAVLDSNEQAMKTRIHRARAYFRKVYVA